MVVAVTGASGLVGSALTAPDHRRSPGDPAGPLPARAKDERQWRPDAPAPDLLSGVDAVVHLAGASIAGRFTEGHKAAIRDSRIEPTQAGAGGGRQRRRPAGVRQRLGRRHLRVRPRRRAVVRGSVRGDGFLADVVADWEAATGPAADAGVRVVTVRTGIVQAAAGGTLRLLRPLFLAGLGGRSGQRQAMAVVDRPRRPARHLLPRFTTPG